ncbi:hypothetical protein SDRG_05510 [Saprolegnia diclina VS20]|uniref:C2 domain-containing protein n=1 Tax=Saprolegnia diclina (strain VS20) TaxID=1156394 RepID=T0QRB3_SAPDV|nr:hypothetical protein SDRG_05510 [Saprolegnia diclina VS20]EQC37286.1 hypothetical protein SDRG_05510 [Saprolegnia diclina VS20]|eukprot:XP_008609448.1 hypothetical protein SDRG_05510 [Saprolegnia diclina VS20]
MLQLDVRAPAARNLVVLDDYSPLAPFCRGTLGNQREITDVAANGGNAPRWYRKMTFTVSLYETDVFQLEVYDKNDLERGMLGACLFRVRDWKVGQLYDRWYPLYYGTMYAGELHIAVQLISRPDPPRPAPAPVAAPAPPPEVPRFVAQPGYPAYSAPSFETLVSGMPSPPPSPSPAPSPPRSPTPRHLAQPGYPGYPRALTPTFRPWGYRSSSLQQ